MKSTTFLRTRQPSEALDQIDERRRMVALDLQCSRGMHGVQPGTLRLVARPLPVRGCHFHRIRSAQIFLRRGRLRLAGRPLDTLHGLHIPPRPYLREYGARCLAASDKLTSWFAGSQAQPIASEECALWRRQSSQFAEKLAVHLITIGLHT